MKPTEVIEKSKIIATWMGWEYWDSKEVTHRTFKSPQGFQNSIARRLRGEEFDPNLRNDEEFDVHTVTEPHGWYGKVPFKVFQEREEYKGKTVYELGFCSDWSKLMEVVTRIEKCLTPEGLDINTEISTRFVQIGEVKLWLGNDHEWKKILMVFDAVAQFCKAELEKPKELQYKPKPIKITRVSHGTTDPV